MGTSIRRREATDLGEGQLAWLEFSNRLEGKIRSMALFAGSWDVTIDTPIGTISAVLDITENDGSIQGVGRTDKESVDFYDVVADGNRLTWLQNVTTPMKLTLKFDVTVDGDAMTGTSKAGILPASKLQGTRSSTP
jgi:hypothetical protein